MNEYANLLMALLIFINVMVLIVTILLGGAIMDLIKTNIQALNDAIAALQGRLGSGVVVQQADIDSVNASLTTAITNIGNLGK